MRTRGIRGRVIAAILGVALIVASAALMGRSPGTVLASAPGEPAPQRERVVTAAALPPVQALDASNVRLVYVATPDGLYRASAPYQNWARRTPLGTLMALSINPGMPGDLLYATEDGTVYRSTDDGVSGTVVTHGLAGLQLVRSNSAPAIVYLRENDDSTGFIMRSPDDGRTWHQVLGPGRQGADATAAINDLAVDPHAADHVLATVSYAHGGAVVESHDGGHTWSSVARSAQAVPDVLALSPLSSADLWVSWRGGATGNTLLHTHTAGRTWLAWDGDLQGTEHVSAIILDSQARIYVASTTEGGRADSAHLYVSHDGGSSFTDFHGGEARGTVSQLAAAGSYLLATAAHTPLEIIKL